MVSLQSLLYYILGNSGSVPEIYYPLEYSILHYGSQVVGNLCYLNEANFFDDDEDCTPWTQYEDLDVGDLWYQTQCGSFNIYNADCPQYSVSPVDSILSPEAPKYSFLYLIGGMVISASRSSGDSGYGTGWPVLKCRLKIGDKYWNGSSWTSSVSDFRNRSWWFDIKVLFTTFTNIVFGKVFWNFWKSSLHLCLSEGDLIKFLINFVCFTGNVSGFTL